MARAAVLWLPHMSGSLGDPYLAPASRGTSTVLGWILDRLAPRLCGWLTAVVGNPGRYGGVLSTLVGPHPPPLIPASTPTKLRAYPEVARILKADHVAFFGGGMVFAPPDLLDRAYAHHLSTGNNLTVVTGIPRGAAVEIYSMDLLCALGELRMAGLPPEPAAAAGRLAAVSRVSGVEPPVAIRAVPFDALRSYGLDGPDMPERVQIEGSSDLEIANEVMCLMDGGLADSDGLAPLRHWKQITLRRAQEARRIFAARFPRPERGCGRNAERKRVLYVSNASAFSGAEESLCTAVARLDRVRFQPLALLGAEGHFSERLRRSGAEVLCRSVNPGPPDTAIFMSLVNLVQDLQPDLLHFNSFVGLPMLYAGTALQIPIIQHVRVADLAGYGECLRGAHSVIAVSEFVRSRLVRLDLPRECVHTVFNGVEPEEFRPGVFDRRDARRGFGIPEESRVVLLVGRFAPNKRHDLLLDAANRIAPRFQDLHVLIVGEVFGDSHWYDVTKDAIKRLGIGRIVTIQGFQSDARLAYAAADVLVSCSDDEPLARSVIEAMAMSLPVLVTRSGGTSEVVSDGLTGFVVARDDPGALADRMAKLLDDDQLRRRLGEAARQHVEMHLTAERTAAGIMRIYEAVLAPLSAAR